MLTEATKSHQAELEKQQDDTEEKLRDERRRFNEELKKRQDENEEKLLNERRRLKKGQDELSAERLLRTYLQQKYDKKLKKEIEDKSKKREEEKQKNAKEKKRRTRNTRENAMSLKRKLRPSQMR